METALTPNNIVMMGADEIGKLEDWGPSGWLAIGFRKSSMMAPKLGLHATKEKAIKRIVPPPGMSSPWRPSSNVPACRAVRSRWTAHRGHSAGPPGYTCAARQDGRISGSRRSHAWGVASFRRTRL